MNQKSTLIILSLFLYFQSYAEVKIENLEFALEGTSYKAYLAYDDIFLGKRPGVVVAHEWWGLNEYPRRRARMLAKEGYVALAIDMYGEGKTADHPKDAGQFSGAVFKNIEAGEKRFQAALNILKSHQYVSEQKIAAIGYCFGGSLVLEMARRGLDLDLVASFHGGLNTPTKASELSLKAKILAYNGLEDPMIDGESRNNFRKEMEAAQADFKMVNFRRVKHGFTNPKADENGKKYNLPLAYSAKADRKSWKSLLRELKLVFK